MKAYAVLAGGGAKAAALAGCLDAARAHQIEFVGYGGTSAGAIVGLMAAVGYAGHELRDLMKKEVRPSVLLSDGGSQLASVLSCAKDLAVILASKKWRIFKAYSLWRWYRRNECHQNLLFNSLGLYDSKLLRYKLLELIARKQPRLAQHTDISFDDLHAARCPEFKAVASNLTTRRAAVFSRCDPEYSKSVLDAVSSSSCFPFLFSPVEVANGDRLSDGGLSSNLPTFLFAREHEHTQYPIIAFDLVDNTAKHAREYGVFTFGHDVLLTALEAGDQLRVGLGHRVFRVPVNLPAGVTTLKFSISPAEVDSLYNAGYNAASEFFTSTPMFQYYKQAGEAIQRQLWAIYGDRKDFENVLWALGRMMEALTGARNVRCQIMLPTGRQDDSRIVTYTWGYRATDSDSDLELGATDGCTGRCIRERTPMVADLEDAKASFAEWGLTEQQQKKIPADRRSMISVPVFAGRRESRRAGEKWPMIAVLSIDSSTPLEQTEWVAVPFNKAKPEISERATGIMKQWAEIVGRLLR